MWRSSALACALALCACDEEAGPAPDLVSDVATLRTIVNEDPAASPIEEAERVARDRPVLAGRMVESSVLPAARDQVRRLESAQIATPEGRTFRRRLREAYEQRVSGLTEWHAYLEGAASDDMLLLDSSRALREAQMALIDVDRDMEAIVPTGPREEARPSSEELRH